MQFVRCLIDFMPFDLIVLNLLRTFWRNFTWWMETFFFLIIGQKSAREKSNDTEQMNK